MIRTVLLFAMFTAIGAVGQNTPWPYGDVVEDTLFRTGQVVTLNVVADYNANSLYNELTYGLWRGSYLERDLRERGSDALRERNSAGYILGASAQWSGRPGALGLPGTWRPELRTAYHDEMGTRFTADVYRLTFFGNAPYEGQRADLGPSAYTWMRYQSFSAGIRHARNASFLRINVLLGRSLASAQVDWAGVYTAEDGRVIRGSLLGEVHVSDTAGSALGRNNGMGASLSGQVVLHWAQHPAWRFVIGADDLGFIRWNDRSMRLATDTVIEFDGWTVANILDLDEVLVGEEQLRDTLGLVFVPGALTTFTPFRLHFTAEHRSPSGWLLALAVDQRNLPGYVPHVRAMAVRPVASWAQLGMDLSYGGFGLLRLGLGGRFHLGRNMRLHLSTPHVPGFFMSTMRGWGVFGGLSVAF